MRKGHKGGEGRRKQSDDILTKFSSNKKKESVFNIDLNMSMAAKDKFIAKTLAM